MLTSKAFLLTETQLTITTLAFEISSIIPAIFLSTKFTFDYQCSSDLCTETHCNIVFLAERHWLPFGGMRSIRFCVIKVSLTARVIHLADILHRSTDDDGGDNSLSEAGGQTSRWPIRRRVKRSAMTTLTADKQSEAFPGLLHAFLVEKSFIR